MDGAARGGIMREIGIGEEGGVGAGVGAGRGKGDDRRAWSRGVVVEALSAEEIGRAVTAPVGGIGIEGVVVGRGTITREGGKGGGIALVRPTTPSAEIAILPTTTADVVVRVPALAPQPALTTPTAPIVAAATLPPVLVLARSTLRPPAAVVRPRLLRSRMPPLHAHPSLSATAIDFLTGRGRRRKRSRRKGAWRRMMGPVRPKRERREWDQKLFLRMRRWQTRRSQK